MLLKYLILNLIIIIIEQINLVSPDPLETWIGRDVPLGNEQGFTSKSRIIKFRSE